MIHAVRSRSLQLVPQQDGPDGDEGAMVTLHLRSSALANVVFLFLYSFHTEMSASTQGFRAGLTSRSCSAPPSHRSSLHLHMANFPGSIAGSFDPGRRPRPFHSNVGVHTQNITCVWDQLNLHIKVQIQQF